MSVRDPAAGEVPAAPATPAAAAAARRGGRELLYAAAAIAAATALYAAAASQAERLPAASSLVGHGIGILGSVLMLMTGNAVLAAQAAHRRALGPCVLVAELPHGHRPRRSVPRAPA